MPNLADSVPTDVSVVIPAYNAECFVCAAIESVFAQQGCSVEVIVVDNNSSDRTCEVVTENYGTRITLVSEPRPGAARARNAGSRLASCTWLAFLDADDLWLQEKLATQIEAANTMGSDMAFTLGEEFHSAELDAYQRARFGLRPQPYALLTPSSLMLRRETFSAVGEFPEVPIGEFVAWQGWARELGMTEFVVPQVLVKRRIHAQNMTRSASNLAAYPMAAKWLLDRRRERRQELAIAGAQSL